MSSSLCKDSLLSISSFRRKTSWLESLELFAVVVEFFKYI